MEAGFEKAVKAYFDGAIKMATGREVRSLKARRSGILTADTRGMSEMLDILDSQDSDYRMSLSVAMFYSGWSPDVWKKRSKHPLYPFREKQKQATKENVDQWVLACFKEKHSEEIKAMQSPSWGRDPASMHPYLIDEATGVVICDGVICGISKPHVAAIAQSGADIRILRFSEALSMPWQHEPMRKVWAVGYRRYLVAITKLAHAALDSFDAGQSADKLQERTVKARGKTTHRRC